jgi:hypothetical protein
MRTSGSFPVSVALGERKVALPPDENRRFLAIANAGPGAGTFNIDQDAGLTSFPLAAGASFTMQNPDSCTHGYIDVFGAAATTFVFITVSE